MEVRLGGAGRKATRTLKPRLFDGSSGRGAQSQGLPDVAPKRATQTGAHTRSTVMFLRTGEIPEALIRELHETVCVCVCVCVIRCHYYFSSTQSTSIPHA